MTPNEFNVIIHNIFHRNWHTLSRKAAEYTDGSDRLSNFKKAGALQGMTAEQALFGMLTKHLVSLAEMVAKDETSLAMWEEKLGDAQNYLYLLEALLIEKHAWPQPGTPKNEEEKECQK